MLMYHQLLLKFLTCPAANCFLGYKLINSFSVHNTYANNSWSVDHAVIRMRLALLNIFFPYRVVLYIFYYEDYKIWYKLVSEITVMFYPHPDYVSFLVLIRNFSIFAD